VAARLKWPFAAVLASGFALAFALDEFKPWAALGFCLALWIAYTVGLAFRDRLRGGGDLPRAFWGMQLAHFGMAVGVAGIAVVAAYSSERDVRMAPGGSAELAGYTFTFRGAGPREGPNFHAMRGTVEVSRNGARVATLHPEKRVYTASGMAMTEASVHPNFFRDVYVALGEPLDDQGAWSVRLFHKPFINWLWLGALLMAIGGFLAATDRRYRLGRAASRAAAKLAAQGA